jgi:hypothetical protein
MRSARAGIAAFVLLVSLATVTPPARAEDRGQLNDCKTMVDQAAQLAKPGAAKPDDAELARCRQIIREWTSRDQRMSVDEQGRPIR